MIAWCHMPTELVQSVAHEFLNAAPLESVRGVRLATRQLVGLQLAQTEHHVPFPASFAVHQPMLRNRVYPILKVPSLGVELERPDPSYHRQPEVLLAIAAILGRPALRPYEPRKQWCMLANERIPSIPAHARGAGLGSERDEPRLKKAYEIGGARLVPEIAAIGPRFVRNRAIPSGPLREIHDPRTRVLNLYRINTQNATSEITYNLS
jgi:hypothetical protein